MASTETGKVYVGGQVEAAERDAFKAIADEHERTFAAELRVAIRAWIDQHGNDK